MNKASFKKQFEASMENIEVDFQLKETLYTHLFTMKFQKKSFWSRYKTFFALPVGATLAVVLFFSMKQTFTPQEALAQALENIFDTESFNTTFGMPNDGDLHYKTIDKTFMTTFKENDDLVQVKERVDLWSDGENIRGDHYYFSDQRSGAYSALANAKDDIFCRHGEEFVEGESDCESLSAYQKENMVEMMGDRGFIPKFNENLLGDYKTFKIEHFKVPDQLTETFGDGWYTLTFNTPQTFPVNGNQVWIGNKPLSWNQAGFINDLYPIAEFEDPSFTNEFKDVNYWHNYLIQSSEEVLYVQFHTTNRQIDSEADIFNYTTDEIKESSALYKINLKHGSIVPVSEKEFHQELDVPKIYSVIQLIREDLMNTTLRPAFYVMKNADLYQEPLSVETLEKNGQTVTALKYLLPNSPDVDPSLTLSGINHIYFYMDEAQTKFIGYSIQKEGGKEIQSVWIEDKILPASEKGKVFSRSEWEKVWLK